MSSTADDSSLLTEFALTRRVVIEWTVLGTGVGFVAAFVFATIYAGATGQPELGFQLTEPTAIVVGFGLLVLSIVGVIVVHELIHATAIWRFGGKVSFGVGVAQFVLPYAYVTTTQRLTRNQFVIVALAPLVVITSVGVLLMVALDVPLLVVPLAVNAGGAIGDLWMVGILRRYPPNVVVEDAVTGVRIYGSADNDVLAPTTMQAFLKRIVLGSVLGFGVLLLGGIAIAVVLGTMGVQSFTLGVPDSVWSVYSFHSGPDGFEASANPIGIVAASVCLGLVYAVVALPRRLPS